MAAASAGYYDDDVVGGGADGDQGVGVGLVDPVGPDTTNQVQAGTINGVSVSPLASWLFRMRVVDPGITPDDWLNKFA